MRSQPNRRHRRSIRLSEYDYTEVGAYFVTICAYNRECLFGEILEGELRLNGFGKTIEDEWLRTATIRPYIELGQVVIMPNHVHGIVSIRDEGRGKARRAPDRKAKQQTVIRRHGSNMAKLTVGDPFPAARLKDIDGLTVEFPGVFGAAPSTVIFF
jgi:REP element-mobilizing transposase RayT